MKYFPKISIVIPSFNKIEFIERTIKSIFSQRYPNFELIIQDGGSTDGSLKIIRKYIKKYPKHIIFESKKDGGQVGAINQGFKKATGDIFAFLNADDVYCKNALLTVGEYYLKHPETIWIAGGGNIINSKGKEISRVASYYKNLLLKINNYNLLLVVNYLMQPSVFISKAAYKKFGPFMGTNEGIVMEYDLWLKIARKYMPVIINKNLSSFRMSGNNISSVSFNKTLNEDEKIAKKNTKNTFILSLHCLHNKTRILIVKLMKSVS